MTTTPMVTNPRLVAALTADRVIRKGRSLEAALGLLPGPSEPREVALAKEMAFGVLRWYFQLEAVARLLLHRPLKPKDGDVLALILVGLYQLQHMGVPAYAAVAETVAAADGLGKPWAKNVVNAVLRRSQREADALRGRLAKDLQAVTAHPGWLLQAIREAWPAQWQEIIQANNLRPPMALRVNVRKTTRDHYLGRLRDADLEAAPSPHVDCGLVLAQAVPVAALPGFAAGEVSVQDLAAQLAAVLLDPAPGQRVLDACAAPGGKTGHILERVPDVAEVVALDIDADRLERVRQNLQRLGLTGKLVVGNAARPDDWWDGRPFDRILLDAPCSGTGVIRRHPDIKLLRRPEDIGKLAARQSRLLAALWPLLASGGKFLYATCSVLPEENEVRVLQFLKTHDEAREYPLAMPCGTARTVGRQILPGEDGMDGFYYTCLEKRKKGGGE